jgi:hypothetical protein
MDCVDVTDNRNIFHTFIPQALGTIVVNSARQKVPSMTFLSTSSVRSDLLKGPFTTDDAMNISPRREPFMFLPDVPYWRVQHLLRHVNNINTNRSASRRDDSLLSKLAARKLSPIKATTLSSGYVTTDDFGHDGDDTPHTPKLSINNLPKIISTSSATFPPFGQLKLDTSIDVIFHRYLAEKMLEGLNQGIDNRTMVATNAADRDGSGQSGDKAPVVNKFYTKADLRLYMPKEFTTADYLPAYVRKTWGEGLDNCSIV